MTQEHPDLRGSWEIPEQQEQPVRRGPWALTVPGAPRDGPGWPGRRVCEVLTVLQATLVLPALLDYQVLRVAQDH